MAGFVATWWHGERQLDLIAARIAAVEQGTSARLNALADPGPNRVEDRLTPVLGQLGAALQGIQASTEALGARIAALPNQAQPVQPPAGPVPAAQTQGSTVVAETPPITALGEPQPLAAPDTVNRRKTETPAAGRAPVVAADDVTPAASGVPARTETVVQLEAPAADAAHAQTAAVVQTKLPASVADLVVAPTAADPDPVPAPGPVVLDSERFTIQLIGFRSPARIAAFAGEHGIASQARWLRAPGKGRTWHLVVLGDYASREEAQAALTALPAGLRALSPLVRSLAAGTELMPAQ
jgi:septal ring-binding cell division protein DamX